MPVLEQEVRQIGINAAKSLSSQIENRRLLSEARPEEKVETLLQELFFWQPNIILVDVIQLDERNNLWRVVGSTIDREGSDPLDNGLFHVGRSITSELKQSGEEIYWEVISPIYAHIHNNETLPIGGVRLHVSLKTIHDVSAAFLKISTTAAILNVIILIIVLSYFLRRTIANDRLLRQAESQNIALTDQLQDLQRELLNNEKLAVMGQLTASFAHEIGTPLNAIGGHLQLLFSELDSNPQLQKRQEIIQSQLHKIEDIVKSFLQSTAKPTSQHQLVDINNIIQRTLSVATPRIDAEKILLRTELDPNLAPIRVVPLEIEQILLNLINNSIDSMRSKKREQAGYQGELRISSASYDEKEKSI
jgi:signal transduction histidine kinase